MNQAATAAAPRERPILFSGPMVRAILAGTKTQTRRTRGLDSFNESPGEWIPEPDVRGANAGLWRFAHRGDRAAGVLPCPYGKRGERLWVRERARRVGAILGESGFPVKIDVQYEADKAISLAVPFPGRLQVVPHGACLSMGCYREASRILLEITEVRVERLNAISEEDAVLEGVGPLPATVFIGTHRQVFGRVWDSINGAGAWDRNPWVWAVSFRRVTP